METNKQKCENLEKEINKILDEMKTLFQSLVFRTMSHREYYMKDVTETLEKSYEKIKNKNV
tara:strand:- start:507 stop:689 length:183 start_codon:yes stop_codon:yes gene_type:complete